MFHMTRHYIAVKKSGSFKWREGSALMAEMIYLLFYQMLWSCLWAIFTSYPTQPLETKICIKCLILYKHFDYLHCETYNCSP